MAKAQWFIGCGTEAVSTLQRNASRPTSISQEVPSDLLQELPGRHELHGCTMGRRHYGGRHDHDAVDEAVPSHPRFASLSGRMTIGCGTQRFWGCGPIRRREM